MKYSNIDTTNLTQDNWKELGFFYETRDKNYLWYLAGSKEGLNNFYTILINYANDKQYNEISAHEHYGPYMYLKIMTWDKPGIDGHSIYGTKDDITKLAEIFATKLKKTPTGDHFIISTDYSPDCKYSIFVDVKEFGFDPSLLDS